MASPITPSPMNPSVVAIFVTAYVECTRMRRRLSHRRRRRVNADRLCCTGAPTRNAHLLETLLGLDGPAIGSLTPQRLRVSNDNRHDPKLIGRRARLFRWVDHTAELELEIEARTEREVLADALKALGELLGVDADDVSRAWEPAERTVSVTASDRPALLAAWLEELVFLAESDGFVALDLRRLELGERELTTTVAGVLDDPPPLVKAVTYHRLLFEPSGDGYVARVVLDV